MYRKKIIIVLSLIAFVTGLLSYSVKIEADEKVVETYEEEEITSSEPEYIYVEVKGAVKKPGIYELAKGIRIFEVLEEVGGVNDNADLTYINQTKMLVDESLLVILTTAEIKKLIEEEEIKALKASQVVEAKEKKEVVGYNYCNCEETSSSGEKQVNLNTASFEQLLVVPNIGETKAKAIIDYRNKNRFEKLEDLLNVPGIGTATFEKIKDFFTL